jgi:hypothetical protein
MPLKTDLNTTPYFDDYDTSKDFYKILFKPSVSIQARELNQFQSILQKQVERFGDNIFVRGTIIDGCNFIHYNPAEYIKINDLLSDGVTPAIPGNYTDLTARSSTTGLAALVIDYVDGFESADPDLKSLYLRYINNGDAGNVTAFTAGETLEVHDYQRSVRSVTVTNGGVAFANSDAIVATSALVVNVASGSFANGVYINDGALANVQIVNVDTTTLADSGQIIWSIKPRDADLSNSAVTADAWSVANNAAIADAGATATAVVERVIGSGYEGSVITNSIGRITSVLTATRGSGYSTSPTVTVKSNGNDSGIAALDLTALNYAAQVVVATTAGAVGNGYAFGITEGVIYQKGYFQRVAAQRVNVSKYDQLPDQLSVGFQTREEIINSNKDTSLLDNATGEHNFLAPGADRLKLVPELTTLASNVSALDPEFFTLVEFSEGRPFRQNKTTQYNKINDEMARRTRDESGDYVIDQFLVSTASPANTSNEANVYTLKVDPGTAYIDGYRIATTDTYSTDVSRTTETRSTTSHVSLNYGNYVVLKEVGGLFQFSTGDLVNLYDTATGFVSNTTHVATGSITPVGNIIGTARIRSMVPVGNLSPEASQVGAADSKYRMYLFDINMSAGKNFADTLGLHYATGTYEGIADVATVTSPSTNTQIAELADRRRNKMLFYSGVQSIHNANAISYTYRTIDETTAMSNNGILTKSIAATPNEFYATTGTLSGSEMQDLYVAPIAADLIAADTLTGTTNYGTGSNVVVGTTTDYLNELVAGDYITVYANSTAGTSLHAVTKVVNSTSIQLDRVGAFANTVATIRRTFPKHIPIPFGTRDGLSGATDANGNILTLTMQYENANDFNIDSTTSVNTAVAVDISRTSADRKTKTPNRTKYVKLALANNAGGTAGPWSIGVPDAFRMRNVYVHTDSTVNTASDSVKNQFYIDHNQNENFYGLSYLYTKPRNNLSLVSGSWLLVEFDYFTESGTGGFFDAISYVSSNTTQRITNDSLPLSGLTTTTHSFEIPQLVSDSGTEYDMINQFDFRPYLETTATPAANAGSAPINPTETQSFGNTADPANDKKFPLPDSIMSASISHYLARIDSVFLSKSGNVVVVAGKPGSNTLNTYPGENPTKALKLTDIYVPPYPNTPIAKSAQFKEIINTKVANIRFLYNRFVDRTIERVKSYNTSTQFTQPRGYTMSDINKLEKRVSDLEYYVGLSLLESDLKDRNIPSSTNPNLNRHKFGFFVDDFADYDKLDTSNPRFNAQIELDDLIPPKMSWVAFFDESSVNNGEYIDFPLVEQLNSSDPADAIEPACLPNTQIANSFVYRSKFAATRVGNTVSSFTDTLSLTFAGGAQEITSNSTVSEIAFVNSAATVFYYAYDKNIKVEIYQGSTLLASTANAVALSNTEKTLVTSTEASAWFDDNYTTFGLDTTVATDYANYMGKIEFTHNPNLGRAYTIRTFKGTDSYRWKLLVRYPIDRSTVGCPPPPPGEPGAPGLPGPRGARGATGATGAGGGGVDP